jgi:hypothetical protein
MFKSSKIYGHYIIIFMCFVDFQHCLRRGVTSVILLHVLVILCFGLGVTECQCTIFLFEDGVKGHI